MSEQLENFINSDTFRDKMEKLTKKTVQDVLLHEDKRRAKEITETIHQTVDVILTKLGLDTENIEETKKDFNHARNSRKGCEFIKKNSATAFITVTVPTLCYCVGNAIVERVITILK